MNDGDRPALHHRITRSVVLGLSAGCAFSLSWLIHNVVQQSGHVGPTPIMVVLFHDLTIAVGIYLVADALSEWVPQVGVWRKWQNRVGHHLSIVACVTALFVVAMIGSGILYALGVI